MVFRQLATPPSCLTTAILAYVPTVSVSACWTRLSKISFGVAKSNRILSLVKYGILTNTRLVCVLIYPSLFCYKEDVNRVEWSKTLLMYISGYTVGLRGLIVVIDRSQAYDREKEGEKRRSVINSCWPCFANTYRPILLLHLRNIGITWTERGWSEKQVSRSAYYQSRIF